MPQTQSFEEKLLNIVTGGAMSLMVSVGHRTRLYDVMAAIGPATSAEIAKRAELSERYVREWLGAMTTGGIVELDEAKGVYTLPPEHAQLLTRTGVANFGVTAQWVGLMGAVEDEVVAAFRHGQGVPYSSYKNFHAVMAEESEQTVVAALESAILPIVPGLIRRLEEGIDVVDVACGLGKAMLTLAKRFPKSRFLGLDVAKEVVDAANEAAVFEKLGTVKFVQQDLAAWAPKTSFDLVTGFDAIHDQAKPQRVLDAIAAALRPGGVFLMQDIGGSSHHHCNKHRPLSPFIYTISCFHCMSVSLANGGPGLGAAWGKEKALEMLGAAGFADVRVEELPHDMINYYYVAKAPA